MSWLIRKTSPDRDDLSVDRNCEVGYFEPSGMWISFRSRLEVDDAVELVHYLNGGGA